MSQNRMVLIKIFTHYDKILFKRRIHGILVKVQEFVKFCTLFISILVRIFRNIYYQIFQCFENKNIQCLILSNYFNQIIVYDINIPFLVYQ